MIPGRHALPIALAAALGFGPLASAAQDFPAKPIHVVVPGTTGTGLDVVTRFVTEQLARRVGKPVLVENREGAGSAIGLAYAAKASADGYTIAATGTNIYFVQHVSEAPVGFEPARDFVPIARVSGSAFVILVPAGSPYKSLQELVQAMQARPREMTFSSGGYGSTSLMCAALLNELTGTTARHIPYRGNTQAVTDAVGGQVDFTCASAIVLPLVKSGKMRALAVTSLSRWPDLAHVPTVQEAGVRDYELSTWIGFMAPARTPASIVQRLSDDITAIARTQEFKDFCDKQGLYVDIAGQKEFAAEVTQEVARWKRLAQLAKEK